MRAPLASGCSPLGGKSLWNGTIDKMWYDLVCDIDDIDKDDDDDADGVGLMMMWR